MIIETLMLGTITLTYKPPQPIVHEVGRLPEPIALIETIKPIALEPIAEIQPLPVKPTQVAQGASSGLNGYDYPSCTGHVALHRYVPPGWGNASNWKASAISAGWTVSATPVAGAIGWRSAHVVFVISVSGDSVTISENNYDFAGSTRTITVPTSTYKYIY